jgi:hypothetical protein
MGEAKPNWKEHPVVVAAAAASAAILFTITIFSTVVIPTMVKDKDLQIAELTKRIEPMEKSVNEAAARVAATADELKVLKQRNLELSRENLFSTDDVYPKGFRKVRIGDPTTKIWDVYPKKDVRDESDRTGDWISVKVSGEFIREVTYYYKNVKGKQVVSGILFLFDTGSTPLIKAQLVEKYGDRLQREKPSSWVLTVLGHDLTLWDSGGYSLRLK